MGYKHFGRIGDIWKHLPLCEIVSGEKIKTYIETNSAYYDYELEHSKEQEYGIDWFIKKSQEKNELIESQYFKIIKPYYKKDKYLGSSGQVMHLLQDKADNFMFYDLDKDALNSIETAARELNILNKVETKLTDSATDLIDLIPKLNPNTFIHIDPYFIHQPNKDGYSYLDGFIKATKKGATCFLWYGFGTLKEKKEINDILKAKLKGGDTQNNISCDELILKEIQEDSIKINPGILGCGILTSNLTKKSIDTIDDFASMLVEIYRDSIFNGVSGELYHNKIIINHVA